MNTQEKKSQFFAQYWGQLVGLRNNSHCNIDAALFYNNKVDETRLLLKQLSLITDEDAVEVAIICFKGNSKELNVIGKEICNNFLLDGYNYCAVKKAAEAFDYLRSKGYLVPFQGINCEDLIRYGWVEVEQ